MALDRINTQYAHFLDITTTADTLTDLLIACPTLNFIHINHEDYADVNLIGIVRKNPAFKPLLVALANHGFHLYVLRDGVSSFVRHRRIATLWKVVTSGDVQCNKNNMFYKVNSPVDHQVQKLVVVFSSIGSVMYTSSLNRHFEQNFKSISKYIPENTAVLRIADMGGVVGSFYLNSHALPDHESHVSALIAQVTRDLGLTNDDVVLYGTSKGGTAATYYSLKDGYSAVAVDPILSDEHYVTTFQDSHFTLGTFPHTKQEKFSQMIQTVHADADLSVVCSQRSPQFPVIEETLINPFRNRFTFFNAQNPKIKDHPDVGPFTLPYTLAQITAKLANLPRSCSGVFDVY